MKAQKLLIIQERILDTLENRFISPEGVLYDFTGLAGEVILPTIEECEANMPNGLGWNTPIANGGFFNGITLLALAKIGEKHPSEKVEKIARILLKGLYVLQDKSPVAGCILRGIGKDGSFYPASSNDQVIPFILGLWEYSQSPLATREEKVECRNRCYSTLKTLEKNDWLIPGTREGFVRGRLSCCNPYDNCHMVLAALILDEMEPLKEGSRLETLIKERGENIAEGYPDFPVAHSWFASHNFYMLRELARKTAGSVWAERFRRAGKLSAEALLRNHALSYWKKHNRHAAFSPDWRALNKVWFPHTTAQEAHKCAIPQRTIWRETSPAVMNERESIMFALSSAWIALFTEDREFLKGVMPEIEEMLLYLPCEQLYYVPFFFALNVISELYFQEKTLLS